MESEEYVKLVPNTGKTRKRKVNKENWKRYQEKVKRYRPKKLPVMPKCKHKNNIFKCSSISSRDALCFHKALYKATSKQLQDCFILSYTKCSSPLRTDRRKSGPTRNLSIKFFIKLENKKQTVRVCQNAFLGITGMSKFRVRNACKKHLETGSLPEETRGGDRKKKPVYR